MIPIVIRLWFLYRIDLRDECSKIAENQPTNITLEQCGDLDFEKPITE